MISADYAAASRDVYARGARSRVSRELGVPLERKRTKKNPLRFAVSRPSNGCAYRCFYSRASRLSVSAYLAVSNRIPEEISGHEEAFRFTPLRTRAIPYPSSSSSPKLMLIEGIRRRVDEIPEVCHLQIQSLYSVCRARKRTLCRAIPIPISIAIKLHWDSEILIFNGSVDMIILL